LLERPGAALAAYIDRIKAEELNFRRFMVKNYHGKTYYHEKCLITIGRDGEITVTNKEYAPTKDEAAAIKEELKKVGFPTHVNATVAGLRELRGLVGADSQLYEFYSRKDGGIVMVQERAMIKGTKAYIPWTYWSDGAWRRMEGDGPLPFYKPKDRTDRARIMVHEGAKTRSFRRSWVIRSRNTHGKRSCLNMNIGARSGEPWHPIAATSRSWSTSDQ
jgi:hypothetical protein